MAVSARQPASPPGTNPSPFNHTGCKRSSTDGRRRDDAAGGRAYQRSRGLDRPVRRNIRCALRGGNTARPSRHAFRPLLPKRHPPICTAPARAHATVLLYDRPARAQPATTHDAKLRSTFAHESDQGASGVCSPWSRGPSGCKVSAIWMPTAPQPPPPPTPPPLRSPRP